MKEQRTTLQRLCFLAKQLEESKHYALNAIQPGLIVFEKKFVTFGTNQFTRKEEDDVCEEALDEVVSELKVLAEYLRCTPLQAALFTATFSTSMNNRSTDFEDIRRFFDLDTIDAQFLQHDFDMLKKTNLLELNNFRIHDDYVIPKEILSAIHNNVPIAEVIQEKKEKTRYDFVTTIGEWVEDIEIKTNELLQRMEKEEEKSGALTFVQNVKMMLPNPRNRVIFYDICYDFIATHRRMSEIDTTLTDIFDSVSERFMWAKQLMQKEHELIKLDLVEIVPEQIFSSADMKLTEKGLELFLEGDFELFSDNKSKEKGLIYPEDIPGKKMFFDEELSRQLLLLMKNLQEERFTELQKRLGEMSMPKGVAAIFHGLPGTGKTETAMQIAKATGRPVCHVDIADSKSCWFGESEKLIKRIFTDYAELCKKATVKPILLFNEADALFSKRKDSVSSNVAQTENAIQNIILEEMEKLDGILIATTNLIANLDEAFERRFLFKIKFGQPTVEAKKAIWKDKLPWLPDTECCILAERYNFSGGEIDNIVRKVIMDEVLNGQRPDLQFIDELCRHEKISGTEVNGIGFKG
jgi:AAA+ superfamily predicted ATPase